MNDAQTQAGQPTPPPPPGGSPNDGRTQAGGPVPPPAPPGGYGYPQQPGQTPPPPPGAPGYGYPQTPPPGAHQGYGYPQQPGQTPPPPPGYGYPQTPPPGAHQGYGYPQAPMYQQPGGYPTVPGGPMPPGGSGGGKGKLYGMIAGVVALVVIAGLGVFFLVGKDDDKGGDDEAKPKPTQTQEGATKPQSTDGKQLFKVPAPGTSGEFSRDSRGAWATDKLLVKTAVDHVVGYDRDSGREVWKIPVGKGTCTATETQSADGKVAVTYTEKAPEKSLVKCDTMALLDIRKGKKVWDKPLPGGEGYSTLSSVAITDDMVAVANGSRGSAGYRLSGKKLWQQTASGNCADYGYAGGSRMLAAVRCGTFTNSTYKVQELNSSGKKVKEFSGLPNKVQAFNIVSVDPLVVGVGVGDYSLTDLYTVDESFKKKARISVPKDKYELRCDTDWGVGGCFNVVADEKGVYLPSKEHEGSSAYGRTNEIWAFDFNTGKTLWKADAGEKRTMRPIQKAKGGILAYKGSGTDIGGEVIHIDTSGSEAKQSTWLRLPFTDEERNLSYGISRDMVIYRDGRLFLQSSTVRDSDLSRYIALGYGSAN
ncbi:PQQ-binding-like beta-propeller repeat protein [Streptomyces sp. NPDC005438]|uniref:outer membrane protein assembly factor BamB family protein n=1 Tax=Streptomyces sp. NPDC005438 TaxID=3156880 RepID=UPI0033AD3685